MKASPVIIVKDKQPKIVVNGRVERPHKPGPTWQRSIWRQPMRRAGK